MKVTDRRVVLAQRAGWLLTSFRPDCANNLPVGKQGVIFFVR
jgi:hypothetical protein